MNQDHAIKSQLAIIKADSRGYFNHGWLKTYHSFSFANYYDRDRMHFGALRVINDDVIAPGMGFGKHPHDNMEIITIPLFGALKHQDSMGHEEVIRPGDVQVMSAGTGLFHAEYNGSDSEGVGLFQIWIMPRRRNVEPTYNQATFSVADAQNKWQTLVAPEGSNHILTIQQQAWVSKAVIQKGKTLLYEQNISSNGSYILLVEGTVEVLGQVLQARDAMAISASPSFEVKALDNVVVLNIEVPMI